MILGIDGSNLRTGGAFTHISRVLAVARPEEHGIREIRIWTTGATVAKLPRRPFLKAIHEPMLDGRLWWRLYWQRTRFPRLARDCDALFVPGGTYMARFSPLVTMSRNMLPFDWPELLRFRLTLTGLRLLLLRFGQTRTYRRADGLIFLTPYARDQVMEVIGHTKCATIIPHGVDDRFRAAPRPQRALAECSESAPLRLLYISTVELYKHQWHVAEAVARLRSQGLPLEIDFVGPSASYALRRLERTLDRLDPQRRFLRYLGEIPFEKLHELRENAELFVFASSCENMPNILLEAMASGFPIACARRGPMPAILGDAGVYFDPDSVDDTERAIRELAADAGLRARCAEEAHRRAAAFSWERCADDTFAFIARVARGAA